MRPSDEALQVIDRVARRWEDPEYSTRAAAADRTLNLDNRFTEEALAFAVNQQMHEVRAEALAAWRGPETPFIRRNVGVLSAGNVPFVELQDFLAVVISGHGYIGALSSRSPHLLPAFVEDLQTEGLKLDVRFTDVDTLFAASGAVIATGTDETREWARSRCVAAGIPEQNRLLRGNRYAVAILDGGESEDELEGLAEDALLHEGLGCRNVALIWAPAGASPDPFLEALAHFRAIFPPHPATPGSLTMQKAFLEAVGTPHAYGDGLEFLLSKGHPEVQQPGHIRWTEYAAPDEVMAWIRAHEEQIQLVVSRETGAFENLDIDLARSTPGSAQRPALEWTPDGQDVMAFLAALV